MDNDPHVGLAMPGDAENGVAEAGGDVGEVHGVHARVQDQLPQVLKDLINVSIALGIPQDGPDIRPLLTERGLDHQAG